MDFSMKLAGRIVRVHTLYEQTSWMCRDYLVADELPADMDIVIGQKELDFEAKKAAEDNPGSHHVMSYLETLAVYRKIAEAMLAYDTFLMHGAVFAVGDAACMITATSGTGKTTLMRQIFARSPEAYVVNGDKPLLRVDREQGKVFACGTPWCGKEHLQKNCEVPLKMICILERGDENSIEEITFSEGLPRLLAQTYRPGEAGLLMKTLSLLGDLKTSVRICKVKMKHYENFSEMEDLAAGMVLELLVKEA